MELTKIEIEQYKSIRSAVTIAFTQNLPTVLIGKNGSGKTNVLEAISSIALANSNYYRSTEKEKPKYKAYIQLSESDMAAMLPDVVYDKSKCEIVAYSTGDDLIIDRIRAENIVDSLRKEIVDIRTLAVQLKESVDQYEKQIIKISHSGREELPIGCYQLKGANGGLTNFDIIYWHANRFIENVNKLLDRMLQCFDDNEKAVTFIAEGQWLYGFERDLFFALEYIEPTLAKFEEKFISINKTAIKREITRINRATKESCDNISRLIKEIKDRTARVQEALDTDYLSRREQDDRYYTFLRNVQHIVGKRCLFLKNESRNVIFKNEDRDYYYNEFSGSVVETYLRQVYKGSDRDQLLKASNRELQLSEQAASEFEQYLNENIPSFDRNMYDSISVKCEKNGRFSIFLNEKTGGQIDLNKSSAGRRWYFTYYFMKNILSEGDIFIIDEPAAMLHPSAQKEVLAELTELAKRGVKVIYSTHSPYLIPEDRRCVQFVTMTDNGTEASNTASDKELIEQMKSVTGNDIFDIEMVVDMYLQGVPDKIAHKCYDTVKSKGTIKEASEHFSCSPDKIKNWNKDITNDKFRKPLLSDVIMVAKYADVNIYELLS